MSKNRNLMVLGAVLVALAAISLLQKVGHERATSRPVAAPLLADKVDRDALRRLEISRGEDPPVVLVNGPAGWEVASRHHHPASEDRVNTLLNDLENLRGEFRSDAADVLPDYGLTDSTAIVIRGYTGDAAGGEGAVAEAAAGDPAASAAAPEPGAAAGPAAGPAAGTTADPTAGPTAGPTAPPAFALQVGERPRGGVGNFVRLPGTTAVYLTQAGILNDLGLYGGPAAPDPKHFLALDALQLEREDVDAIELFDGGKLVMALEKEFPAPVPQAAATAAAAPPATAPATAADATEATAKPAASSSGTADDAGAAPEAAADAAMAMAATDQMPDRQTYEWRLTAPLRKSALKTKADAILGALTIIRAADVADPDVDPALYGLAEPAHRAVVKTKDGQQRELLIGSQRAESPGEPGGFYFKIAGERPVYVIRQYQVDNIFKQPKDVLPES